MRTEMRAAHLITIATILFAASCSSPVKPDPPPPPPVTLNGTCGFAVPSTDVTRSVPREGGQVDVHVQTSTANTAGSCVWTVNLKDDSSGFVTLVDPATGSSSAAVADVVLTVAPNTQGARTGHVTIADVEFAVQQAEAPCVFTLSGDVDRTFPASGGTGRIAVTKTQGGSCSWTASATNFISITSGASGTNDGTVTFTVDRNTGAERTASLTVAGQSIRIGQDSGAVTCRFSVSPTAINFGANGGTQTIAVTRTEGSNCSWSATTSSPLITITSAASGTDNGTITISVAANTGGPRSGAVTVGGQTVSVTQDGGAACAFTVSPTALQIGPLGGTATVTVTRTQGSNCAWATVTTDPFITITSGATGTGDGVVTFTVAPNTGVSTRTGSLNVAGQTVSITQSAPAVCQFSVAPTTISIPGAGGAATITVTRTAGNNCSWTAATNVAFVAITSGSAGTDNGSVSLTVLPNTGATTRTATLTIAGQTVTLNQDPGSVSCQFSVAPLAIASPAAGGTVSVAVTVVQGSSCAWTAASASAFVAVTSGASGTGSGTVTLTVSANTGAERSATVTIAGQTVTVSQLGVSTGSRIITGGSIAPQSATSEIAAFSASGSGFTLNGPSLDGGTLACSPCAAGSSYTISYVGSGSVGVGNGTIDGTSYASIYYDGNLRVSASVTVPTTGLNSYTLSAPFSITSGSTLNGWADSARTQPIFRWGVSGSGTMAFTLTLIAGTNLYSISSIRYDFR